MPEFIRVDIFPATVEVAGEVFERVRAVVTDDALHVWKEGAYGPEEAYYGRLEDFSGDRKLATATLSTDSEPVTATITKTSGCGCGSRLKGFRPFPGVRVLPM